VLRALLGVVECRKGRVEDVESDKDVGDSVETGEGEQSTTAGHNSVLSCSPPLPRCHVHYRRGRGRSKGK
jgi:hypothetical protein